MSYGDIQWLPLTAGLTVLGLLLSYVIFRRSGVRPALRAVAVSLLPIAAYLTGATEMLWKIGTAIGQFGTGFAFSTTKWVGIGVTGLAIALFLAAGGRARRKASKEARRAAQGRQDESAVNHGADRHDALTGARTPATRALATTQTPVPANRKPAAAPAKASRKAAPADDDDLKDIEDILRKRGI
ncbi:MAG: cellulose synthase [Trebonia sp.]|jgi:hypothetical protein